MQHYHAERQRSFEREPIDGGTLVFRRAADGRQLVGFADVEDWSAIRAELCRRGLAVGALHHLPVVEEGV